MTAVAEGIGFRAAGIAGATITTADLARARVFYLARLGFPVLHEENNAFAFEAGASTITIRCDVSDVEAPAASTTRPSGFERIAVWCASLDDLRAVAEALTAAGIEHSRGASASRFGAECVAFKDPDGIEWELLVR